MYIPYIPEMVKILQRKFPNSSSDSIADAAAILYYSFFFSLGNILGPVVGGNLTRFLGFSRATSIMSLIIIAIVTIYIVYNLYLTYFSKKEKQKKIREALLPKEIK